MWVRGNGWMAFLLDGCCPLFFSLAIPIGVARVAGVVAVLSAHGGPMLNDFHSFFYALITLQGSLPDIKCETEVNINLLENVIF